MSKVKGRQPPRSVPAHWGGTPDPEDLDDTPVEMPISACRPTPLNELIARAVQQAFESEGNDQVESWDEANDFEEEDPDALDMSPYELTELHPEPLPSAEIEADKPSEAPEAPEEESGREPPQPEPEARPEASG